MSGVARVGTECAGELAAVHGQCFEQPWNAETFIRLMDQAGTFALLIRGEDKRAAGFALVRVAAGESELLSLGVAPARRRQGIARRLLAAALDRAAIAGASQMVLEVAEDNEAARGLYAAFGFHQIGRRVRYYARTAGAADAITMKRSFDN